MNPEHNSPPDCWHLWCIIPFIIILGTLIDTLFDQKRWIRVSSCEKCRSFLLRKCFLQSLYLHSHFNLLSPLASCLLVSCSPWHALSFQTAQWKKVKIFLSVLFSCCCGSQTPACSVWNGSWSKTTANGGKESWTGSCSAQFTGWFNLVHYEWWSIFIGHTCTPNVIIFQILSSCIFLTGNACA